MLEERVKPSVIWVNYVCTLSMVMLSPQVWKTCSRDNIREGRFHKICRILQFCYWDFMQMLKMIKAQNCCKTSTHFKRSIYCPKSKLEHQLSTHFTNCTIHSGYVNSRQGSISSSAAALLAQVACSTAVILQNVVCPCPHLWLDIFKKNFSFS